MERSPEKRKTERCEDMERRKRPRTTRETDAERNEADAELPALHDQRAERGILRLYQYGSDFGGQYNVYDQGSLHQGNVINIKEINIGQEVNIRQEANQCLVHLRVTDPRHDKMRIQDIKGGLLSDCYVWVLDNPEFCQWRDNEEPRLLWVKGDPGKGKTMLLCGIIDQLERTLAEGWTLSYFFCEDTNEHRRNATAVLRGLMYRLLHEDNSLISPLKKEYDLASQALFQDDNAWYALREIFKNMLHDPKLQGVYLVVDALDECVDKRTQLLKLIVETSQLAPVKWLVSSRNVPQIEEELRNVAQVLSLENNVQSVAAAVDSYITHKLSELQKSKLYPKNTAQEVHQQLLSKADNTFLWVALVCQDLGKGRRGNVLQKVKSFPSGLSAIYEQMMQQIRISEDADLCTRVLALVATTYRPLSLVESIVFIEEGSSTVEDAESLLGIIGLCGSFLTVREETIHFVHQSAKEFLIKEASDVLCPKKQAAIHRHIFSKSIKAMSQTLKRDIYRLSNPGFPIEDVFRQIPDPDPLAAIRYSCIHWVNHLVNASKDRGRDNAQDGRAVYEFLKRSFLYWLESLSLLKGISDGVLAIERLIDYIQTQPRASQIQALVHDAYRFTESFRVPIESQPLQTYTSALIFSPRQSIVRGLFLHEAPDWVQCRTEIAEQWTASDDAYDADDESTEGKLQRRTDHVNIAAFSANGQHVITASSDNTAKIWDTATGKCKATLKAHTDVINIAVFSANGQHVITASFDNTAKIWDTATGKCKATLTHTNVINIAVFSANGQYVITASFDNTAKIWDTATGKCKATLKGLISSIKTAAFSADRQHVITASLDNTVKIWDTATGKCEATLEGDYSSLVSFDPTGMHINTNTGTIRLDGTILPKKGWSKPTPADQQEYGLSADRVWIQKQSKPVLWLPSEYRPHSYAVAAVDGGTNFVLGSLSGWVCIIHFS